MTIALDTEVVATAYDEASRICSYTIARHGKRWTVKIPIDHLDAYKGPTHKEQRRNHLANLLQQAMQSPHDGER